MTSFCLDVRVLRSFVSVVETQSITETARRLGRTQPAITLQMKRLEDSIGKVLFRPDSRRPVLTDDGGWRFLFRCAEVAVQLWCGHPRWRRHPDRHRTDQPAVELVSRQVQHTGVRFAAL